MSRGVRVGTAHQAVVRALQVAEVLQLSPALRRIVLTGPDLLGVTMPDGYRLAPMSSTGFDDRLLVMLPEPGEDRPALPVQGRGRIERRPDGRVGVRRSYTVRRWEPESARLTIDFVLHGHGPAASWAATCQPGDTLHVLGPGISHAPPAQVDWLLIAGDETALPAIARWLEEMEPDTIADVLIEVDGAAQAIDLAAPTGASITWLYRNGRPASDSTLLADAVRALPLRSGPGFAWVAAESDVVRPIRSYLRDERQMPRGQVQVTGYWRRGAAEDDEADHEHHEHSHDHDDHHDDEVAGLAERLDRSGLLSPGAVVRVRGVGARRITAELTACRPDLLVDADGLGVTLLHLDDDASSVTNEAAIADAARDLAAGDTLLAVVPPETEVRLPPGLAPADRHDLDWLGEVVVLHRAGA